MAPLSRAGPPGRDGRCSPSSTASCARPCCSLVVALFFGLHFADGRTSPTALRAARDRLDLVRRARHGDRRPAADLAREGRPARLHRPGPAARRLRRLLPGRRSCPSGCSGSRRSRRRPTRCAGSAAAILDGAGARRLLGRHLAAARARRRRDPARPRGLPAPASATPSATASSSGQARRGQGGHARRGQGGRASLGAPGRLAQLVERLPYKQEVGGSSPSSPTQNLLQNQRLSSFILLDSQRESVLGLMIGPHSGSGGAREDRAPGAGRARAPDEAATRVGPGGLLD